MPFTAAHTYIAHIWQYPPPPPPGILPVNFASYVVFLHGGLKEVHEPFFDVSKFNCLSYFFGKPKQIGFRLD